MLMLNTGTSHSCVFIYMGNAVLIYDIANGDYIVLITCIFFFYIPLPIDFLS